MGIFRIVLLLGLVVFLAYEVISIIKLFIDNRKSKQKNIEKGDDCL